MEKSLRKFHLLFRLTQSLYMKKTGWKGILKFYEESMHQK